MGKAFDAPSFEAAQECRAALAKIQEACQTHSDGAFREVFTSYRKDSALRLIQEVAERELGQAIQRYENP